MKMTRPFACGSVGALALTAATLPGLSAATVTGLEIIGALSIAFLGKAAGECPRNCPGTDGNGNGKPVERKPIPITIGVLSFLVGAVLLSGCVASNPRHTTTSTNEPPYIVAPALAVTSNTAAMIAPTAGTLTGTGPLLPVAVNTLFGLIGALSLAYAAHKNSVASQLASAVAATGPTTTGTVLDNANGGTKYAAIAGLLNAALPNGQAPGQPPPPAKP
jgi:hypothetical protein